MIKKKWTKEYQQYLRWTLYLGLYNTLEYDFEYMNFEEIHSAMFGLFNERNHNFA